MRTFLYTYGFSVAKLPPWSAVSLANAGIFLLGSGLPNPQSTETPEPLAKGVGQGCDLHTQAAPDLEWGPLGAQKRKSRKLRSAATWFRFLVPVQQVPPRQIAMNQSPCSWPPAAYLCAPLLKAAAAAGLKP